MTDPKALAEEIKARHLAVTAERVVALSGRREPRNVCARCGELDPCDAYRAADALLEAAKAQDALAQHALQCPQFLARVKADLLADDSPCSCGHGRKSHYEWGVLVKPLECFKRGCKCVGYYAARNAKEVSRE
jgi:hypothetical protein